MTMTLAPAPSIDSNTKLWAQLCLSSSALRSANLMSKDASSITAVWTQRDVIATRKRFYSTTYTLSLGRFVPSAPVEILNPSAANTFYSPTRSKLLRFVAKNESKENASASLLAELWAADGGLLNVWEIPDTTHGPVFTDEWFGRVTWSPDESMVAYVADRPKPRTEKDKEDPRSSWRDPLEFKFHEDARNPLGEAYIAQRSPAIFVANVLSGKVCIASDTPELSSAFMFGEPEWSADGKWIAATMRRGAYIPVDEACEEEHLLPYDLGIRYCYNRYSAVVLFCAPAAIDDVPGMAKTMRVVSSHTQFDDFCCNSPRFSLDSKQIVYVSTPRKPEAKDTKKISPHNQTKILRCVSLRSGKVGVPYTLIDIPPDPTQREFPGLYLHSLPGNPWIDSKTIVFSTVWGSIYKVLCVTFDTRRGDFEAPDQLNIKDLSLTASEIMSRNGLYDISQGCAEVIDVWENMVLISASNPSTPPQLFLMEMSEKHDVEDVKQVSTLSKSAQELRKYVHSIATYDMVAQDPSSRESFEKFAYLFNDARDSTETRFQITVITPPPRNQATKLVVFPHGGPHVASLNGYSQAAMALLRSGYAVLYVNYRGSLGLGQQSLESLPGNIGVQDINEVVQATKWAIREYSFDRTNVGFVGGSHSGFIGAHASLVPQLFSRTVLRNPVVDVAGMVASTDIPDWCFCEAGVAASEGLVPDAEARARMHECSPVNFVSKVSDSSARPGKTLLQVGGMDKRVPPGQSLVWRRIMNSTFGKGNVVLRWYERSGHAIDEVPEGDDAWVAALDFLGEMGK